MMGKEKKEAKKRNATRGVGLSQGMAYGHPGRDSSRHHQHQRPTAADTRQPVGRQCKRARVFFIDVVARPTNHLALICHHTGTFGEGAFSYNTI